MSTTNRARVPRRALLASGIGAGLFYIAALVLGPGQWPGYSTKDQTVSELFAIDAPSRPLVVSLLFVSGLLALAAYLLWMAVLAVMLLRSDLTVVPVLEDLVEGDTEDPRDLERDLERG